MKSSGLNINSNLRYVVYILVILVTQCVLASSIQVLNYREEPIVVIQDKNISSLEFTLNDGLFSCPPVACLDETMEKRYSYAYFLFFFDLLISLFRNI